MPATPTAAGRPTSSGRRTSSRSAADEPSTSSAAVADDDAEAPVPMETEEPGDDAVGPIDPRVSYICSILLAENRAIRDKLISGNGPLRKNNEADARERELRIQPVIQQIQHVEQLILKDSLESVLKNPKYAVMGDLKPVEAPEASSSRAMHPIEVKIEEADASGSAAGAPSALGESNMETAVKRENHVLARIAELRKSGLWSNSRLPKCVEPERNKTHWDYLLEEVKWMATDFRAETNTKRKIAKVIAHSIAKQHRDKEIEVERAAEREIKEKKRMCAGIAKMIRDFWQGVDKVVDIRAKEILESRLRKARNKHLMFMIGQVDEMSNIVQERLVESKTPSIASHDDDKEFDAGDESESDDERTIANAEKSQKKDDVKKEVDALQNEANVEIDDFLSSLPPEYLKEYGLTLEDVEEMKKENKREREEEEARRKSSAEETPMEVDEPGTSTQAEKEVEKSQDNGAEDGNGDGRGVLRNVDYIKLNSHDSDERQQELTNIAEEALKFQPKGYTLETTQVKTPVPFLIRGTLREYQMVGLDWMVTLYEKNLNGILADEMGLGKTIQTISLLSHLACSESIWGPHLIVVPTSVILNWEMEFKKWCPALKILTYFGTAKERAEKRKGWMKPNCFHVCITSYKTVTQDIRAFKQRAWQYLILDEAQNIKNWKSQRWQALLNVRARRRLLLTGTPLQNSLMELWSLMHFLMPTIFSSHDDFKDWFSNPLTGMMEGSVDYNGPLIQRLHKVLRPFILRRLKKEVEKQLPEKTEHVINCSLSKRQRYLYDDFMSRRSTKENLKSGNMMSVLNIVMQLRKCCNHPNLFEPRPVVSPFVVDKLQVDVPAYFFQISQQDPETEQVPEIFNLSHRFGYQSQVSSRKPMIEEMDAMDSVLDLTPPQVDGFRFSRTAYVAKNNRDQSVDGIGSEEEVRVNGNNGVHHSPATNRAVIRTRTVLNTAPLTIATDRSGFHYTMASNGRTMLDEKAPHSPPLKRAKMTGAAINWADYVPEHVVEKMEESKRTQLEIVRRRFGDIKQPIVANELIALIYEEISGQFPRLRRQSNEHIQENLLDYVELLADRFGMYVEPVLTDAWQCRPSSSGLPSYIRNNLNKIEKDSRTYLLKSSTNLDTQMSISRSLQFPELRLIEYDCGKLQTLAVLLRQLYLYKHRCLIFTQMSKMLDVLQTFLSHHGYQYFRLDGTTGVEQRQAMMERFNADPKIFCFILSTRSGGVGVNLTGADTVIFYDSDWNPTMDAQAQDRCHRIGQTRNVSIYRLISERTIEENILKKAMQKKRLGELAIDEAGFTPEFFKQSDNIRDLFDGENVDVAAPKDVPVNEKELETAMAKCEDEADVNAAKIAKAEARVDVAEFDETAKAPTSNLAGDEEADEKYMELIQQLKPIERFAINLLEAEYKPEFEEECKEAEAMIEQKREEWDKNLNESQPDEQNLLDDDDLFNNYQSGSLLDEFMADGFDELMPVWLPPSPPSSDGEFDLRMEDDAFDLLYEIDPMNEARLPSVILELKRPLAEKQKQLSNDNIMKDKDATLYDAVAKALQMPATDPIAASPAYTENSFSMDDSSQDAKLEPPEPQPQNVVNAKAPKRRRTDTRSAQSRSGESGVKRATTPPPAFREEPDYDGAEWNIVEDHALLQAVQLEFANHHLVERSIQEGMVLNWELVSQAVNKQTRFYRSPRQCSIRYQMFVRPKELGQLVASDPITKKTMKVDLSPTELSHLRRGRMTTDSQYNHDYGLMTDRKHVNRFKTVRQVGHRRQVQFWRGPRVVESRKLQTLGGAMPTRHEAKMAEFEVKTGVILDVEDVITIPEEQANMLDVCKRKLMQASKQMKPPTRAEPRFNSLVVRPWTVPQSNLDPMPARRNMIIAVPALQRAPILTQNQSPTPAPPAPPPIQHQNPQHQPQPQQQHIQLPPLQSHSQVGQGSQQHQQSQVQQQPQQQQPQQLPPLQQQQPMPLRQVGSQGPQIMSHNNHEGAGPMVQNHQIHGGHGNHGQHSGNHHGGHHAVVQQSQMPLQRRTASGSNVQYLQQGSLQQGQGQSYMVVPSSNQQQPGDGGQQSQRVQYVQGGRGGYGNTLVMQSRGRVVRPAGSIQQRVYIGPDRQYTIPNVVPVRVMPSNQRIMTGQRRNPPAPGTVAAMVLPARGNGQIRTIPRGGYAGQQRINVMVSSQNMRQVGQGGIVSQGPSVRRQLVGRPLSQRVDATPTVAQVVVAPPSGMTNSGGGGPPVLHMQRASSMQQVPGPSSAPPPSAAPPPPPPIPSSAPPSVPPPAPSNPKP